MTPPRHSISISPKLRDMLVGWPAGEERKYPERYWGYQYSSGAKLLDVPPCNYGVGMLERLAEAGYVRRIKPIRDARGNDVGFVWKRTDKVCKPYQPKRVEPGAVFPYTEYEHWQLVKNSPLRAPRQIAEELMSAETRSDATPMLHARYPYVLKTEAQLRSARRLLLFLLTGKRDKHRRGGVYFGTHPLTHMLASGATLHLLFMEMLIEPVFDEAGKFVRFVAVGGERAAAEFERLTGATADVGERYQQWLAQQSTNLTRVA